MNWPLVIIFLLTGGAAIGLFVVGFSTGCSIAKQGVEHELGQAYMRGRRDERAEQRREPLP